MKKWAHRLRSGAHFLWPYVESFTSETGFSVSKVDGEAVGFDG